MTVRDFIRRIVCCGSNIKCPHCEVEWRSTEIRDHLRARFSKSARRCPTHQYYRV